jgi:hypothetical protein
MRELQPMVPGDRVFSAIHHLQRDLEHAQEGVESWNGTGYDGLPVIVTFWKVF